MTTLKQTVTNGQDRRITTKRAYLSGCSLMRVNVYETGTEAATGENNYIEIMTEYWSYSTLIALWIGGKGLYVNDQNYSQTTACHYRKVLKDYLKDYSHTCYTEDSFNVKAYRKAFPNRVLEHHKLLDLREEARYGDSLDELLKSFYAVKAGE